MEIDPKNEYQEGMKVEEEMEAIFDTTNIGRKIWLVKIAAGVAEAWSKLPPGAELGTVRISDKVMPNGQQPMSMHLAKKEVGDVETNIKGPKMVSQYKLAKTPHRDASDLLVFSENPANGSVSMEGKVALRADSQPEFSLEYKTLMQNRARACLPDRMTMEYTETGRERYQKNTFTVKPPPAVKADPLDKRVRMEKGELQSKLFELFQAHQYYRIQSLMEKTQQPMQWLKEVLKEIAIYHTKGEFKNLWELKQEYRAYVSDDVQKKN